MPANLLIIAVMWDTLSCIWAGLAGRLNAYNEARRLVWLLIVTYLFGWLATAFVCWVSQPTYLALIEYLPGAGTVSWGFAGGVAAFLYFGLAYVAGYWVERMRGVPDAQRNYTPLGARVIGLAVVMFAGCDLYMQTQGAHYRAADVAGEPERLAYQDNTLAERMAGDSERLNAIEGGKVGGYGWRDPKTGTYHLNNGGKRAADELRANIRRAAQADSLQRVAAFGAVEAANTRKADLQARADKTLSGASYAVYVVILLLCIVQAYVVETIQAALLPDGRPGAAGGGSRTERDAVRGAVHSPLVLNDTPGKIGYEYTGGTVASAKGTTHACQHCGTAYTRRTVWQKYCGEPCRIAAFEARTGRTVKRKGAAADAMRTDG